MDEKAPERASKPGKRRWRVVAVLCALMVGGLAAVAFWPGEKEPEYQGKKLSEWVMLYKGSEYSRSGGQTNEEAADAIQTIGTNGVPILVNWILYDKPGWRTNLVNTFDKLPQSLRNKSIRRWLKQEEREMLAYKASRAFKVLGRDGISAVSSIAPLLNEPKGTPRHWRAFMALSYIGRSIRESEGGRQDVTLEQLRPAWNPHVGTTNEFRRKIGPKTWETNAVKGEPNFLNLEF